MSILQGNRVETFGCQYTDSRPIKKSPAWGEIANFLRIIQILRTIPQDVHQKTLTLPGRASLLTRFHRNTTLHRTPFRFFQVFRVKVGSFLPKKLFCEFLLRGH